jgi:hypothetical protein
MSEILPTKINIKKSFCKKRIFSKPDLVFDIWHFFLSPTGYFAHHGYTYNHTAWMSNIDLFKRAYTLISSESKKKKKKKHQSTHNMTSFYALGFNQIKKHLLLTIVIDTLKKETLLQIVNLAKHVKPPCLSNVPLTLLLVSESYTTQSFQQLSTEMSSMIFFNPLECLSRAHMFKAQPQIKLTLVTSEQMTKYKLQLPLIKKTDPLIKFWIPPAGFNKTYLVEIDRLCHCGYEKMYKLCQ